jgi:hypothetical protein
VPVAGFVWLATVAFGDGEIVEASGAGFATGIVVSWPDDDEASGAATGTSTGLSTASLAMMGCLGACSLVHEMVLSWSFGAAKGTGGVVWLTMGPIAISTFFGGEGTGGGGTGEAGAVSCFLSELEPRLGEGTRGRDVVVGTKMGVAAERSTLLAGDETGSVGAVSCVLIELGLSLGELTGRGEVVRATTGLMASSTSLTGRETGEVGAVSCVLIELRLSLGGEAGAGTRGVVF